jgi:hypothetical protein
LIEIASFRRKAWTAHRRNALWPRPNAAGRLQLSTAPPARRIYAIALRAPFQMTHASLASGKANEIFAAWDLVVVDLPWFGLLLTNRRSASGISLIVFVTEPVKTDIACIIRRLNNIFGMKSCSREAALTGACQASRR